MQPKIIEQQHETPGGATDYHYRVLLLAIIAMAAEDARNHLAGRPCYDDLRRTAGPPAVAWFRESPRFVALCELADLDPEAVRAAVLGEASDPNIPKLGNTK